MIGTYRGVNVPVDHDMEKEVVLKRIIDPMVGENASMTVTDFFVRVNCGAHHQALLPRVRARYPSLPPPHRT
jgi:hypothetical protein